MKPTALALAGLLSLPLLAHAEEDDRTHFPAMQPPPASKPLDQLAIAVAELAPGGGIDPGRDAGQQRAMRSGLCEHNSSIAARNFWTRGEESTENESRRCGPATL